MPVCYPRRVNRYADFGKVLNVVMILPNLRIVQPVGLKNQILIYCQLPAYVVQVDEQE